jgi:hypothetical protein
MGECQLRVHEIVSTKRHHVIKDRSLGGHDIRIHVIEQSNNDGDQKVSTESRCKRRMSTHHDRTGQEQFSDVITSD